MTQPNYQPQLPYDPDQSNLETLSIFYFIIAGLQALFACFGLLYVLFGVLIGFAGMAGANRPGDAGAAAVGAGMFICFGVVFILLAGTIAFLNYKTGRSLRARRNLTLCYVMAIIHCLLFPLGTILGVFTLVVLNRPSVKASFT
jgi:hypothetical protein